MARPSGESVCQGDRAKVRLLITDNLGAAEGTADPRRTPFDRHATGLCKPRLPRKAAAGFEPAITDLHVRPLNRLGTPPFCCSPQGDTTSAEVFAADRGPGLAAA